MRRAGGWTRRGFVLGSAGAAVSRAAEPDLITQARALRPVDTSAAQEAMLDEMEGRARQALAAVKRAKSAREADAARAGLREQLTESLGLRRLPEGRATEARVAGTVRREGYRVEKLVWESLPGAKVPAHLYVPDGPGKHPAILFYVGHWWPDSKMRPDFQAFCISAARLGFVVLTWDPFGQGERGISQRDHRRTETLLAGIAQQGIAEFETQCALGYLETRPEVDAQRIGMTGASGGGYNTWMTAALDDRIKTAVPVVGTSEFFRQIQFGRTHDWYKAGEHCHFVPGLIRYANNHELLAMIAPRPLLIINSEDDPGFHPEGAREVYEYGRGLYGSYGAAEKVRYFVEPKSNHGYQQAKREAAYGWFLKWLMGQGDGTAKAETTVRTEPFDAAEFRCLPKAEGSGAAILAWTRKQCAAQRASGKALDNPALAGLRATGAAKAPAVGTRRVQRLEFACGALKVPGVLVTAGEAAKGTIIALNDGGKERVLEDDWIEAALGKNWTVLAVDPRGFGELENPKPNWTAAVSLLLNDSWVARQASDLAAVTSGVTRPVLYARGHSACMAAMLAIAKQPGALRGFVLREGFIDYRHWLTRQAHPASFELRGENNFRGQVYDREIPMAYFTFGGFAYGNLPDLLRGSRGAVIDALDGDWNVLKEGDLRRILPEGTGVGRSAADALL